MKNWLYVGARADTAVTCGEPVVLGRPYCACHCDRARGKPAQGLEGMAGIDLSVVRPVHVA